MERFASKFLVSALIIRDIRKNALAPVQPNQNDCPPRPYGLSFWQLCLNAERKSENPLLSELTVELSGLLRFPSPRRSDHIEEHGKSGWTGTVILPLAFAPPFDLLLPAA